MYCCLALSFRVSPMCYYWAVGVLWEWDNMGVILLSREKRWEALLSLPLCPLLLPFHCLFSSSPCSPFSLSHLRRHLNLSSNNKRDFSDSWRYLATLVQPTKSYVRYLRGTFLVAATGHPLRPQATAAPAARQPSRASGRYNLLRSISAIIGRAPEPPPSSSSPPWLSLDSIQRGWVAARAEPESLFR